MPTGLIPDMKLMGTLQLKINISKQMDYLKKLIHAIELHSVEGIQVPAFQIR